MVADTEVIMVVLVHIILLFITVHMVIIQEAIIIVRERILSHMAELKDQAPFHPDGTVMYLL
jgi:hypothetical protein